jgi:hypothetical protein
MVFTMLSVTIDKVEKLNSIRALRGMKFLFGQYKACEINAVALRHIPHSNPPFVKTTHFEDVTKNFAGAGSKMDVEFVCFLRCNNSKNIFHQCSSSAN